MKKIITLLIVCVILMTSIIPASAAEKAKKLQFDKNGEFKVLHLADCQDGYPAQEKMFIYINYMLDTDMRLVKSEIDPENENTIIIRDYFFDGYDARITFKPDDILNPLIEMEDQAFGPTSDAFGTLYGDGIIRMYQPTAYTSYFSSCEKFIFQYMTLYVPGMAEGTNTVGTFVNAVEWISDDEAEKLKREGY